MTTATKKPHARARGVPFAITLTEAIEVIDCTEAAEANLRAAVHGEDAGEGDENGDGSGSGSGFGYGSGDG